MISANFSQFSMILHLLFFSSNYIAGVCVLISIDMVSCSAFSIPPSTHISSSYCSTFCWRINYFRSQLLASANWSVISVIYSSSLFTTKHDPSGESNDVLAIKRTRKSIKRHPAFCSRVTIFFVFNLRAASLYLNNAPPAAADVAPTSDFDMTALRRARTRREIRNSAADSLFHFHRFSFFALLSCSLPALSPSPSSWLPLSFFSLLLIDFFVLLLRRQDTLSKQAWSQHFHKQNFRLRFRRCLLYWIKMISDILRHG